ncbi:helix-turn-helix domain-containing protein [Luteimonas huabeiensis]|uniref:helix-turn-helix domain-containing protein n=1 Tax=Luteimonas huabeiensis TaxID=1244513 RepID=UPI0005BD84F5|nr:helix-turn-helix transcriptional regulator [Luteimonas huabeiensis]
MSKDWIGHDEATARLRTIAGVDEGAALQQRISRLGDLLRQVREAHLKLPQTEAARLIGIPQSELSRLEAGTGARGPTFATLTAIVDSYERYLAPSGVTLDLTLNVTVDQEESAHYPLAGHLLRAG